RVYWRHSSRPPLEGPGLPSRRFPLMAHRSLRSVLILVCLLPVCSLPAPVTGDEKAPPPLAKPADSSAPPSDMEMRFTDGSSLRLTLREERLELVTPYGKLQLPVADVQRVDFASRTPADVA